MKLSIGINFKAIKCVNCNEEVPLLNAFTNTCDSCGTDYDGQGNKLATREEWGWETGETAADIFYGGEDY